MDFSPYLTPETCFSEKPAWPRATTNNENTIGAAHNPSCPRE